MKRLRFLLRKESIGLFLIFALCLQGKAQERGNDKARLSPNALVSQTIGTTKITIAYGRPGVKGRNIFGTLIPYGKVWRTGANESTNITFSKDVTLGNHQLKAGTYSLYTIPGKDTWTVIVNSKLSWGTEYDPDKDVFRFVVQPEEADHREWLMFYFRNLTDNSATAVVHWDNIKVPFTIKI
ncbi:MAG TPA: DUF2911 domain-containing protein [Balneolaceae bacterium]|nr:DUF2911 domain-containing protein [Balneolaceae bacterium]